jgi:hypothetical protein
LYENSPTACQSILNRMSVNEDDLIELLKFFQRCFTKHHDCFDKAKLDGLVAYISAKIQYVEFCYDGDYNRLTKKQKQKHVLYRKTIWRNAVAPLLKSLPIHKNIFGDYGKISDGQTVQSINVFKMPRNGINEYCQAKRFLFISPEPLYEKIIQFLEIPSISPVKFYSDFLAWIEPVNKNHLEKHIWFIQSCWKLNEYKTDVNLVNTLKSCRFIPVQNGYKRANELYNPWLRVFQDTFYCRSLVPPQEMQTPDWLEFLKNIGLKELTDAHDFVALANIIRKRYVDENPNHDKVVFNTAASRLIEHLQTLPNRDEILKDLRTIKFIPRIADNQINFKLYPVSQDDLVCMENSTFECNTNLAWCVKPILPAYCQVLQTNAESGIVVQVALKDVVANFLLFVERLKQRPELLKTDDWYELDKLVQSIYKHLTANVAEAELAQLKNVECVFHLFSKTIRISKPELFYTDLDESDEIDGHWYKLPISLRDFTQLFKGLGTMDTPTVQCCQTILSDVSRLANLKPLGPNGIRVAFIAIRYLLKCVGKSTGTQTYSGLICVPNYNGCMRLLEHLYYADKPSQKFLLSTSDELRNMCVFDIDELKITSETGKQMYWDDIFSGFEFFAGTKAPQPLSNIIIENILTDADDVPVESDDHLTDKFKRKEFEKSLIALMNKFLTVPYTESDGKVERLMNKLCLYTKNSIRFNYKNKSSGEIIQHTDSEKDYLAVPSFESLNIYRKCKDIEPYEYNQFMAEYYQFIAETICDELIKTVTDKDSKDQLKMNAIEIVKVIVKLITNDIERYESILEKFDVRPINLNSDRMHSITPTLGNMVSISHRELLKPIDDSVCLSIGQYVAYFAHNEYRYGSVVAIGKAASDLKISKGDQTKAVALDNVYVFSR